MELCLYCAVGLVVLILLGNWIWSRSQASRDNRLPPGSSGHDSQSLANLKNYQIIRKLLDDREIDFDTYRKLLKAFSLGPQDLGQASPYLPAVPPPLPAAYRQPAPAPIRPAEPVAESAIEIPPIPAPEFRAPQYTPPPPPPPPAPKPVKPAKPFSEVLGAFMREANIRWGELVGGLLVVGCSIALVQTFWVDIAEQIWLKSAVFTAITAAIYAVGLYTEHRWKLPNTSRAVLLVASVLTPLTLLGILASKNVQGASLLAGSLSLLILGSLLVPASRVLTPRFPWAFFLCVLSGGVGLLASAFMIRTQDTFLQIPHIQLLVPLLPSLAGCLWATFRQNKQDPFDSSCADQLFIHLAGALGALMPMGLWIFSLANPGYYANELRQLAILIPLPAASFLAIGGLVWKRAQGPENANRKIAGTTLTLLGFALLILAVALSYPLMQAPILCMGYALGLLGVAAWLNKKEITFGAMAFLAGALALWPDLSWSTHYPLFVLCLSSLFAILSILGKIPRLRAWRFPMGQGAITLACVILILKLYTFALTGFLSADARWDIAQYALWACAIVLACAIALFTVEAFEIFILFAAVTGSATALALCPTGYSPEHWIPALAIGVLGISILSGAVRRFLPTPIPLLSSLRTDRTIAHFSLYVLGILAAIKFGAGLFDELTPAQIDGISSAPTLLLAGLGVAVGAAIFLHRLDKFWGVFVGIALAMAVSCANPINSTASVCRWTCALLQGGLCAHELLRKQSKPHVAYGLPVLFILALTLIPAAFQLSGNPAAGPTANSLFFKIGASSNYLPPLLIIVASLSILAPRKTPAYACNAGWILNLTVLLAYALWLNSNGYSLDLKAGIRIAQYVSIATTLYAAGWLACLRFKKPLDPTFLIAHLFIGWLAALSMFIIAQVGLWMNQTHDWMPLADAWGIASLALMAALMYAWLWISQRSIPFALHTVAIFFACDLIGIRLDSSDHNLALHAQIAGWLLGSFVLLGLGMIGARSFCGVDWPRKNEAVFSSLLLLILGFVVSNIVRFNDPLTHRNMTLLVFAAAVAHMLFLSVWNLRNGFLHAMGLLCLAGAWIYADESSRPIQLRMTLVGYALAAGGLLSLVMDRVVLRAVRGGHEVETPLGWHNLACLFSAIMGVGVGVVWLATSRGIDAHYFYMQGAFVLLSIACLWDPRSFFAIPSLYFLVLFGLLFSTEPLSRHIDLDFRHFVALLGTHHLLWTLGFNQRVALMNLGDKINVPRRKNWPASGSVFLLSLSFILLLIPVTPAVFFSQFARHLNERMSTASCLFLFAASFGLLGAEPGKKFLKHVCLVLGILFFTLWCLALADFHDHAGVFNQLVLALAALVISTVLTLLIPRWTEKASEEWTRCIRNMTPFAGGLAGLTLLITLVSEVTLYPNETPDMSTWAFLTILLSLVGLAAGLFYHAFLRNQERWVYIAQLLIGVVFLHLRLTHPQWFGSGFFARNWPLIFLGIAYANAGVSEWLHRMGKSKLSRPFMNIGAFLPVLVVCGFGVASEKFVSPSIGLTTTLLIVSALYFALSITRGAFVLSLAGILAANGALWSSLWNSQDLSFFKHPQLWISPLALCTLVSAQINRSKLNAKTLAALRYACLCSIYAASSADIWLADQTLAMPLVLAFLAALGVFLGIAFRVQSFLFMGAVFMLVSMVALIRLASQQVAANWPWLIAGVVFGAAIVVLFALFEKKRVEMTAMIDRLKEWEG